MGFFNNKFEEDAYFEEHDDTLLHSLNILRSMEVIDIKTGSKIGFIKDFVLDTDKNKVISIILPRSNKGWFSNDDDIEIPWSKVKKAGIEVILVDSSDIDEFNLKNDN